MNIRNVVIAVTSILLVAEVLDAQILPKTAPLMVEGDVAMQMVEGIDRYLMRELAASAQRRGAF